MKAIIIEDNLLKAMKAELKQLNVASELTSIDIYVGDDHLRISCLTGMVDMIMEDITKMIRIPGESVICHESFKLEDSSFADCSKWPLILNRGKLRDTLIKEFGLVRMFECRAENCYIKTTGYGFASEFAKIHECQITKYLTRL